MFVYGKTKRGLVKLQGTIAGLSFINNKTYGAYVRVARGTHRKAGINSVLKANSKNAAVITGIGSPILKQLKALEPGFIPGELWSRMMGCMYKAKSSLTKDLLDSINGMEINERYPFAKLFTALPSLEVSKKKGRLTIEWRFYHMPGFQKK